MAANNFQKECRKILFYCFIFKSIFLYEFKTGTLFSTRNEILMSPTIYFLILKYILGIEMYGLYSFISYLWDL